MPMPYSNLIQNCLKVRLKATQFLTTMSSTTTTSLQFCFHFNTAPLLHCPSQIRFICSAKGSSNSSVVLRRKRNGSSSSSFSFPYLYQQNLGYGRFAYDEYESESESDRETESSKQLVSV